MTKQIQISCDWEKGQFGGGDYWVTITPELARKIVALAKPTRTAKPKRTQAQRDAAHIRKTVKLWHTTLPQEYKDRMLAIADRLEKQQ